MTPATLPGYRIEGANGRTVEIPPGQFYFNTKARGAHMVNGILSREARQVFSCVELHTMGYRSEIAITDASGRRLTITEIGRKTKLPVSRVRRAFRRELEPRGLACRRPVSGCGALVKGQVEIVSPALPEPPQADPPDGGKPKEDSARPQYPESFVPIVSRYLKRLKVPAERFAGMTQESARVLNSRIEASARKREEADNEVRAALEDVCAQPEKSPHIRKTETTERKNVRTNGQPPPTTEPVRPSVFLPAEPSEPEIPPIRDKLRTFLVSQAAHFRLATAPDAKILNELAAIVENEDVLEGLRAQVEKQNGTHIKTWAWFLAIARSVKELHAEGKKPPAFENGVCSVCEGRGVVSKVIRGIGSVATCECQRRAQAAAP